MDPKKEMIYAGLSNGSICKWASRSADPTVFWMNLFDCLGYDKVKGPGHRIHS